MLSLRSILLCYNELFRGERLLRKLSMTGDWIL